tara:strand:- start:113 stop:841 length:729 start_codon:yes stop_codon:yes gene_type:complete
MSSFKIRSSFKMRMRLSTNQTSQRNLVIIPSVISPINKKLCYTDNNHPKDFFRSQFSPEERFKQMKETIKSVKQNIPNNYIVILECSNNIDNYEEYLKDNVDLYINYYDNLDIREKVEGLYKGWAEIYTMYKFLSSIDLSIYNMIIKVSGRYIINANFDFKNFLRDDNVSSGSYKSGSINTTLYKIDKKNYKKFLDNILPMKDELLEGKCLENILPKYNNFFIINPIGLEGNLAPCGIRVNQ